MKAHSLLRQTVDIRGLYFGGAVATEIAVAQVVRVDEDDVWLFGCRRTTQDEAEEGQVFVHSLLDGKLEGFDQWLGDIGRGIGQPQFDLEAKALGQIREIELGGCFGDLLGEALDVFIVFLGLLPLGPLVDFAILVRIDAHPGFHLFNPRTGAHVIVCGLGDEIESSLRESDVGIGMALADFPAKGKGLVYARGREPGDPDSLVCGVKVAKEVVLPADGNGRPVSVSVLLGFVDLIFGDVALETLGILPLPVRVKVFGHLAGGLGTLVHGGSHDGVPVDAVGADGMAGEGGVPRMLAGIDRAPILEDDVEFTIDIADDGAVRAIGGIVEGQAHVLAGFPIGQVLVDEQVGVLIIGEIVIDEGFAVHLLGRGHPFGEPGVTHPWCTQWIMSLLCQA